MIPDYQTLMRPVLNVSKDGEISISAAVKLLESTYALSKEEKTKLLPSGKQTQFANRVHWARSYLKQAGLVENPRRGYFTITKAGMLTLESNEKIDNNYLERFESYQEFKSRAGSKSSDDNQISTKRIETPDELLRIGFQQLNNSLTLELLEKLRDGDPSFFEKTIVQLLLKMGYGSSDSSGHVLGGAGDDGVDGVINQDPLGVDQVYVQAKRYKIGSNISSGAIRDFYGALGLKDVTKGIFVTTSEFSKKAKETAGKLGARIVLIDGVRLAELMIEHEIGCRVEEIFKISRLDDGYFE